MRLSAKMPRLCRNHSLRLISSSLVLVLALIACPFVVASVSSDYGDEGGLLSGGNGGGDIMSSSDDIYEPSLLQQDVEMDEQQQQHANNDDFDAMPNDEEEDSDYDPRMETTTTAPRSNVLRNMATNHLHPTNKHNSMEKRMSADTEYADLGEDYTDMETADGRATATTTTEGADTKTTTISEYIRKGKVLGKATATTTTTMRAIAKESAKSMPANDDDDYEDEPAGDADMEASKKSQTIPVPMKFYQDESEAQDSREVNDNNLKETVKTTKTRHQNEGRGDDDYYDESVENMDVKPPQTKPRHKTIATTTPTTTTTTTATTKATTMKNQMPNIAIARALPIFPPLSGFFQAALPSPTPQQLTTTTTTVAEAPGSTATPMPMPTALPTAAVVTAGLSEPPSPTPTTATTTAAMAAGKQGKQINITRRKLLPHEQLRNYIEDAYIRMPLAVIVDPSVESLEKTKTLWTDALERTTLNIKIVLVSLNDSGVPAAYSFNNTRQFLAGLNSIKEHNGGDAFVGVVHASELVPYDSAVFISTAAIPPHTELVQDAAITLLKKRIRLYLMWYGERALSENETQEAVGGILGEVAVRSGGDILHIVGSESSQEVEGSNALILVADAFRGSQEVEIPVDTTLSSLHVKIDAPMRSATLETPNGDINLRKLVKFKSLVLTLGPNDMRLDAFVPLTKLHKAATYKLKMTPEDLSTEYSVFVRAERKADLFLDDMIKRFDSFFLEGISSYPSRFHDTRLQSLTTALAAASMPTHDNIRFADDEDDIQTDTADEPKGEVETFSEQEIHGLTPITTTATPQMLNASAPTNGDIVVPPKSREQSILQRNGGTVIVMGLQSQVLVAPGMMAQLFFELTNTRAEAIFHNIQVVDERRFLLRLAPRSIFLRPGQTETVSVTLLVPSGTAQGTTDRITFTCHGGESTSLALNVKVITSSDGQDSTSPSVSWQFGGRCDNVDSTDTARCLDRFWTLDVTAQDWESGIMRLQSTPASGLLYRNTYTVGSTEPLKATYLATCCEPKVTLTAYDISGNQRTYNVDVRDIVLTEASIAAIVLGVLLLLLLIVVLVVSIVYCYRRRKISLDLPTYRSHSTRSME